MNNKTATRIQIRDFLIALIEARGQFRASLLADQNLPLWIMARPPEQADQPDNSSARREVADICLSLTYAHDQPGQETRKLAGLVGISATTMAHGEHLNRCKQQFKESIQLYRQLFGTGFEMTDLSSRELRETILGKMQIQHIHFVQCYRQLKLFAIAPKRVGFSWAAGTHGSVRLKVAKAIEHLRSNFTLGRGVLEDIRLLETLPFDSEVVIKRPLVPHLRANLTWPDPIKALRKTDQEQRKQWPGQVNAPLPLFIQMGTGDPLPEYNRIQPWTPDGKQERLTRCDRQLAPPVRSPRVPNFSLEGPLLDPIIKPKLGKNLLDHRPVLLPGTRQGLKSKDIQGTGGAITNQQIERFYSR